jgi:hypothetical protein
MFFLFPDLKAGTLRLDNSSLIPDLKVGAIEVNNLKVGVIDSKDLLSIPFS